MLTAQVAIPPPWFLLLMIYFPLSTPLTFGFVLATFKKSFSQTQQLPVLRKRATGLLLSSCFNFGCALFVLCIASKYPPLDSETVLFGIMLMASIVFSFWTSRRIAAFPFDVEPHDPGGSNA